MSNFDPTTGPHHVGDCYHEYVQQNKTLSQYVCQRSYHRECDTVAIVNDENKIKEENGDGVKGTPLWFKHSRSITHVRVARYIRKRLLGHLMFVGALNCNSMAHDV